MLSEDFLCSKGFIKSKGKFGEYFLHEKQKYFRCWFVEEKLQIGIKDSANNICIEIAEVKNKRDFTDLFRIVTREKVIEVSDGLEKNGYSFESGV